MSGSSLSEQRVEADRPDGTDPPPCCAESRQTVAGEAPLIGQAEQPPRCRLGCQLAFWAVIVLSLGTAGWLVESSRHHQEVMIGQMRQTNLANARNTSRYLADYFTDILKDLNLISHHRDVVAWSRRAQPFIDQIYHANYPQHRLTEIYLVQRDFDGTGRPFMTFEHESESGGDGPDDDHAPAGHDLESEKDEYAEQIRHLRRFEAQPDLPFLVSGPLNLCAGMRGMIVSVPVRRDGRLIGLVAGMVPLPAVQEILENANCHEMTALFVHPGQRPVCCADMPEPLARQINNQRHHLLRERIGNLDDLPCSAAYSFLVQPVRLNGQKTFDLVYLHDDRAHMAPYLWGPVRAEWMGALLIVLLGVALAVMLRMLTALRLAQRRLQAQHRRLHQTNQMLRHITEGIPDGVLLIDTDFRIHWANPAMCRHLGRSLDQLIGRTCHEVTHARPSPCREPDDPCPLTRQGDPSRPLLHRHKQADGSTRYVEVSAQPLRDEQGRVTHYVHVAHDVTDRIELEHRLRYQADHDRLTGLANRSCLLRHLEQAMARHRREPAHSFALLFLDFDRFKIVNDSLGHAVGDQLLTSIARRLEAVVRQTGRSPGDPGDLIARLGGDEFVILLNDLAEPGDAQVVADRLLQAMAQPHVIGDHQLVSTPSIGIVHGHRRYRHPQDILRDADTAMYRAKSSGRSQSVVFDDGMHQAVRAQMELERQLRQAVQEQQFVLYYQPIISLEQGTLSGFEALLRWQHPQRGLLAPPHFLDLAEELGLMVPIGQWVIDQACSQLRQWIDRWPDSRLTVAINLCQQQLLSVDLDQVVAQAARQHGVPLDALHMEITEEVIAAEQKAILDMIHRLRRQGTKIYLDDFGTGRSSMNRLQKLPIDVLKIDRSFVFQMDQHRQYSAIIHAIVTLAQNLNLQVVAEGIENTDQLVQLQSFGCDYGQGYLFARPMPPDPCLAYISQQMHSRPALGVARPA